MHENPLLWGSLIGIGTFMLGSTASSFIPKMDRFSGLIGLALAATAVYFLYTKGNERAAARPQQEAPDNGQPGLVPV